jgi:hypothetical protein
LRLWKRKDLSVGRGLWKRKDLWRRGLKREPLV